MQSPFIFDLYTRVILPRKNYYSFPEIEGVRSMLAKNDTKIQVNELGAGSHISNGSSRKISTIVNNAAKSERIGQVLFSLCNHFQPYNCIELGTSLGISTLYQYNARKDANWTTIEGCPEIARYAKKVFSAHKAGNIKIEIGSFSQVLPKVLSTLDKVDYVFFDGNHTKKSTISYFETCIDKAHAATYFVFDDIHWSSEMEEAWEYITRHEKVVVTVDLFWMGLVFFNPKQEKENFSLKF